MSCPPEFSVSFFPANRKYPRYEYYLQFKSILFSSPKHDRTCKGRSSSSSTRRKTKREKVHHPAESGDSSKGAGCETRGVAALFLSLSLATLAGGGGKGARRAVVSCCQSASASDQLPLPPSTSVEPSALPAVGRAGVGGEGRAATSFST